MYGTPKKMITACLLGLLRPQIRRRLAAAPPRISTPVCVLKLATSSYHQNHHHHRYDDIVNTIDADLDWNDRIAIQNKWNNKAKGWQVRVEWQDTGAYGVGLFAAQDIVKDTILRVGLLGVNLYQFKTVQDIETFCQKATTDDEQYARLMYVKDYLWGLCLHTDERGYELTTELDDDREPNSTTIPRSSEQGDNRFYGMLIPGNSLNHNLEPNIIYRWMGNNNGIHLVALQDIAKGEELFDDYRRFGKAPDWLLTFARDKQIPLNFVGCNDFVV